MSPCARMQLDTDESYTLDIPASGVATLAAATIYGAMHGLETLSQAGCAALRCDLRGLCRLALRFAAD